MKSEEFLKLWEKCDTSGKVETDIPEAPDEKFIKCLNGTVGEKWIQNNTDAKCISENLPKFTCKTTVQQKKLGFMDHSGNVTNAQICSLSKDQETENIIYEALSYIDAFLLQKPNMKVVNGQLTCTEGDAIYCVGEFCNSELDFDKTKEKTVKCFPDKEEMCHRFHQDGMAENFYEKHIYELACSETSNYECQQFIELNRGNCIHRTIYNYHPDEIGYCSPAKECYRNEKPYYFSENESPDIYLTNTTTDGQGCYCIVYLMDLSGSESTPVIDEESNFQLFSYSIDHFHVPKFDSNGFCWMNIEDLYWRKDDVIAKNDKFSRELVCNFDGCNDPKIIKEILGDRPWENTIKCYPKSYRSLTDCDVEAKPKVWSSSEISLTAFLIVALILAVITGFKLTDIHKKMKKEAKKKRDLDEYDMEMIPETKLENFDLTDFEIHSVILKRNNSNIFCLHSKNKDLVEEQRTSFESETSAKPLIETPSESRILKENQEKFCLAFVCKNDCDWTSIHQLINVHGFLYPTRRQSNQQSNENLLNAGSEYLKEYFPKISNLNSRKNSATNSKSEYNSVRNSDLPHYLTDWREVVYTKEMRKLFPDTNDCAKVFICELPAGFQPISLYNLAIQHIENQKGFSLDIRLQIMAQLAEVVEHIEEDFPFSILKDLNHNGIEMNPCLVLINESFLNQGINTDDRNKIKLILCPEINSESNFDEGGIGDPRIYKMTAECEKTRQQIILRDIELNLQTKFIEQLKHMIGITAQLHDDKISPIIKDHPFLQFINLDEKEPIFLTDLDPDLIAGEQIANYLFIRPSYRFGFARDRHNYLDNFDAILWQGRVMKSGENHKIKLNEAIKRIITDGFYYLSDSSCD